MIEMTDIVTRQDKPFVSRNYNDRVNISKIKLKRYREDLLLVLDDGYHVPGGSTGRVLTGMGMGTDLVTRRKPIPVSTPDPHIHGGSGWIGDLKKPIVTGMRCMPMPNTTSYTVYNLL